MLHQKGKNYKMAYSQSEKIFLLYEKFFGNRKLVFLLLGLKAVFQLNNTKTLFSYLQIGKVYAILKW